jgi:hypothetical protein
MRYTRRVRRLLSITLVLLFSFSLISPLLALGETAESKLPACCRRSGAHHCTMPPDQLAALANGRHFTIVRSKCPMFPQATVAVHHETLSLHAPALLFAEVLSHPAQFRQVEAWARVALAGARHKRGPPTLRLS